MKLPAILMAIATPAMAQEAPIDIAAAQAQLQARLSAGGPQPPRLSVPADAALLRKANDVNQLRALDLGDATALFQRCTGPGTWATIYMLWGTQRPNTLDAAVTALQSSAAATNIVRYQDEIATIFPATLVCSKRISLLISRSLVARPVEKRANAPGVAGVRAGMIDLLVGIFQGQADPKLRPANKALMLSELAVEPADSLTLLTAAQRRQVRQELAKAIRTPDIASREALAAFAQVMDTTPCTDACLVP